MATRRLTDAFLLMRNNAIQNRQILAEQVSTYDPRLSTRSNAAVSGLHRFDILMCVCLHIASNRCVFASYRSVLVADIII